MIAHQPTDDEIAEFRRQFKDFHHEKGTHYTIVPVQQHAQTSQLEAENITLAKQINALHKWFTCRPDSDERDTRLAEWYKQGQSIFLSREE